MPGASVSDVPSPPLPPPPQLTVLSEERTALLELWELRRQQYEQCMDLQLFYRDTEQVDNWMSKQEVSGVGTGHLCVLLSWPVLCRCGSASRGGRGCRLPWALPAPFLLLRLKGP